MPKKVMNFRIRKSHKNSQKKPNTAGFWYRFLKRFEPFGVLLTVIFTVFGSYFIIIETHDRQAERIFRAWEILISKNEKMQQSSVYRRALGFLNEKSSGLCLPDLLSGFCILPSKTRESFGGIDLSHSNLNRTNLQGANLLGANLEGTLLGLANLEGTLLAGANLKGTHLELTNLKGAYLRYANLEGAYPVLANLEGADLSGAHLANINNITDLSMAYQCADRPVKNLAEHITPPEIVECDEWGDRIVP